MSHGLRQETNMYAARRTTTSRSSTTNLHLPQCCRRANLPASNRLTRTRNGAKRHLQSSDGPCFHAACHAAVLVRLGHALIPSDAASKAIADKVNADVVATALVCTPGCGHWGSLFPRRARR
eukprot:4604171-Amphidinium_carterae.1